MGLLSDSWLLDVVSLLTAVVTIFLSWVKWKQTFWQRNGIPIPPNTFFFGHAKEILLQKESFADFTVKKYEYLKKQKSRHGGTYIFTMPWYMVMDLGLIKSIMQTDFDHFVDRGFYYNEETDPLSAHLVALEGAKWRNLRVKLTPAFTSGKMKMMFETLVKCGDQLVTELDKSVEKGPIDIKDVSGRLTMDIISNCAFGIDCNCIKDPNNEINEKFKTFFIEDFWGNLTGFICFLAPNLAKKLGLRTIKPELSEYFLRMMKDTVEYREKNNIFRKDFMHLLLQLKNRGKLADDENVVEVKGQKSEVALSMNELAAQSFIFFIGGFETTATTMTFCLFELATNPDVQEKVRQEIEDVLAKHDNKLTYDAIMEMHYLDKVINETLRKYPPLPTLNRVCTKDYKIPGTDVTLTKGMPVEIPVYAIQRDPDYYPDPEKFDPDRFSEENKKKRPAFTFMPFGEGPRVCIGLRFGVMQTKVGLCALLKNYKFYLNSKTGVPLKLDPKSFILSTEGGIWLDYAKV